jgi:flagellar hook-basal body complex protein FliE
MAVEFLGKTIAGAARSSLTRTGGAVTPAPAGNDAGNAFAESLGKLIDGVEDTQANANAAVTNMVEGKGEVHDAMIALQRAEMSLQLTIQIRNKLVQAYQDIMRMSV